MSISMGAARRVLVIGETLKGQAHEAFQQSAIEVGTVERLTDLAGHGPIPDLVLIDAAATEPLLLARAIEDLAASPMTPAVILVGRSPATGVVRALLRLSRSDILEPPHTAADLSLAAACLLAPTGGPAGQAPAEQRCWAVMGAVGGAGATTLAIELATAISRLGSARPKVALVDLNLSDGAAAAYLGVAPNMTIGQTALAADRIDADLLDVLVAKPTSTLDLLASPRDPKGFEHTEAKTILRLLDVACHTYGAVVLDMPRHRQPWTLAALGGCDEIIVVAELTVPALLAARALADEIEAEIPDGPKPRIVLNRLAARLFGPSPSLAEAERALGRRADGAISSDWEAAAASVNLGGPISHHRPKSKIVRDIETLAKRLLVESPRGLGARAA